MIYIIFFISAKKISYVYIYFVKNKILPRIVFYLKWLISHLGEKNLLNEKYITPEKRNLYATISR